MSPLIAAKEAILMYTFLRTISVRYNSLYYYCYLQSFTQLAIPMRIYFMFKLSISFSYYLKHIRSRQITRKCRHYCKKKQLNNSVIQFLITKGFKREILKCYAFPFSNLNTAYNWNYLKLKKLTTTALIDEILKEIERERKWKCYQIYNF